MDYKLSKMKHFVLQMVLKSSSNPSTAPRGRQQLHNLKRTLPGNSGRDSIWSTLMMQTAETDKDCYIQRFLSTSNNKSITLYYQDQMDFLRGKFFDNTTVSPVVIYIDCTYNLTDYYALVTSVRCDLFVGDPLVIGPILLTKRRQAADYLELFREISRHVGEDHGVMFAVTDGEDGIIKALESAMPGLTLLRCGLHLSDNVVRKAREMVIPETIVDQIRKCHKQQFEYSQTTFDDQIAQDYDRWSIIAAEKGCVLTMQRFISYYKKKIAPVVAQNLQSLHLNHGVVTPISNQPAESVNSMIKRCTGEKNKVDSLIGLLKEHMACQSYELKRGFSGLSQKFILRNLDEELNDEIEVSDST